jgi:hypothetical protein
MRDEYRYENPGDADNTVRVYECECGDIAISVAEEQAMDSYNSTFECDVYIPRAEAERLRDWLTQALSRPPNVTKKHEGGWHF